VNFRRATLSDLPALMALQERCHEPSLRDSEADAAHDIATNEYLVACDGEHVIGAAIGCCAASGEWFHVYSVETDPQHQRRGIGHRLMVALLARAPAGAILSADAATLGGAALLRKFPQIEVRNAAHDASLK
jgi:ribosomal protein S18 acetylase RimI-like enzyme